MRQGREEAVVPQATNARRGHQRRQASEQFVGREKKEERPGAGSFHAADAITPPASRCRPRAPGRAQRVRKPHVSTVVFTSLFERFVADRTSNLQIRVRYRVFRNLDSHSPVA